MKGGECINDKELRFCHYYHLLRSPAQAARRAGYLFPVAEKTALKLLCRDDVLARIDALDRLRERRNLKAAVRSGLERIAFESDADALALLLQGTGLSETTADLFRVSEIKRSKPDCFEIKFYSRFEALRMLQQLVEDLDENDALRALCQAFSTPPEEASHELFPKTADGADLVDAE